MRKHAFEDGDVVKLESGAVGIYSGDDWLGLAAPAGKVWVVIDGDVAAIDPAEISKFGGRSAMRTEAEIVRDLQQAEGLAEERELVRELELFRQGRTAAVQADLEIDISNAFIRDTLTPVLPYMHHTSATDWIEEEAISGPYDHQMRVEATMWFKRVSAEVKADREEFGEQAQGMARRVSGQYGLQAEAAFHAFLETVARLHRMGADTPDKTSTCSKCGRSLEYFSDPEDDEARNWQDTTDGSSYCPADGGDHSPTTTARRHTADDKPGEVDEDQSGNAESAITDYDTQDDQEPFLGEDWEDPEHSGVHPEMPGAGEGSRENEPRPEKESSRQAAIVDPTCIHCGRPIEQAAPNDEYGAYVGTWIDPEATGDDSIWRETCDENDTFEANHEPGVVGTASLQKQADVMCATCGHEFWDHLAVPGPPLGMVGRCRFGDCEQFTSEETIEAGASRKTAARPLYEIAGEIRRDWKNVYFGAVPYLDALSSLNTINDMYGYDDARGIVAYFLSNASSWRGETAKAVKAELKGMLKGASKTAAGYTEAWYFLQLHPRDLGITDEEYEAQYGVPYTGWSGEDNLYYSQEEAEAAREAVSAEHGKVMLMGRTTIDLRPQSSLHKQADTCSKCGDSIERDPEGEEPRTYHHTSGGSHDHEAEPSSDDGESKESSRKTGAFAGYIVGVDDGGPYEIMGDASETDDTPEEAFYSIHGFWDEVDTTGVKKMHIRIWDVDTDEYAYFWEPSNPGVLEGAYSGEKIPVTASRRTAGESFGLANSRGEFLVDTETGGIRVTKSEVNAGRFNRPTADSLLASVQSQMGGEWEVVSLTASRRTAGVYCKTHDVWIGDGNEANHDEGCDKEQRATEKTKDARRASDSGKGRGGQDAPSRGARKTGSVSLTNVSIVDREGRIFSGTDPSGNTVQFQASEKDAQDLFFVMFGDLAGNFTGVTVDDEDIIATGSRTAAMRGGQPGQSVMSIDYGQRPNYSTLPSKDVKILPDVHHCEKCGKVTRYEPGKDMYGFGGKHFHADGSESDHYVSPRVSCPYCNNDDPGSVRFRQLAWHDALECDRCGATAGRAIGD